MSMRDCKGCGKEFDHSGMGRPRKYCYGCKPFRAKAPPRKVTRQDIAEEQAPHCAFCGAFTAGPGVAFCNPAHRAAFAQRVQAEQMRRAGTKLRRPSYVSGKSGRKTGSTVVI